MIRASIPVIRVSRQENKDLFARLIFHDADSSAACVKQQQQQQQQQQQHSRAKNTRRFVETFITNFDALIIFIRRVGPEISLFLKTQDRPMWQLKTTNRQKT